MTISTLLVMQFCLKNFYSKITVDIKRKINFSSLFTGINNKMYVKGQNLFLINYLKFGSLWIRLAHFGLDWLTLD